MNTLGASSNLEHVGIVGSGLIGRSWAMLFAAVGYQVRLYDVDQQQVIRAQQDILQQLKQLHTDGLLRTSLSVEQQAQLIQGTTSLHDCVKGAKYVQECVPESLQLKTDVFKEIDAVAEYRTILASSTSAMPASTFTHDLEHKSQVIVAHPVNPPFYCPLTEVCPAPYTEAWVTEGTMDIMKQIGQVPVLIKKEVKGFVLNRIQYALLAECWNLIADDVVSVEDIDKTMTDGLGMRYAFVGPLETCHLNAEGWLDYCKKYGKGINKVTSTFGPAQKFEGTNLEKITEVLNEKYPLEQLQERRARRDCRLAALAQLKRDLVTKQ